MTLPRIIFHFCCDYWFGTSFSSPFVRDDRIESLTVFFYRKNRTTIMKSLTKAKDIKSISFELVSSYTTADSKELIKAISMSVNKKLSSTCTVVSISHSVEVKVSVKNITSKINLHIKEVSGNELVRKEEPKELHLISYEQLKKDAELNDGVYRGKLYGSIKSFSCAKKVDCPDCSGSGICSVCDGNRQIKCTVCYGDKECVSCGGSGNYTCNNCGGSGTCPDCNDGWVNCDDCDGEGTVCCSECNGDGEVSCPDCYGSGNYIDTTCNKCGGSGYYRGDKECRACGGTGRYVVECKRCDGKGTIECDNCDGDGYVDCDTCEGDGGWNCKSCHGSGKCAHCRGKGSLRCKACKGSGECGKCKGRGKIWCPDCHGKGKCFNCAGERIVKCSRCNGTGIYQSYTEYSFTPIESTKEFISIPVGKNTISSISGTLCYKGILYEFYAQQARIFDLDSVINSMNGSHVDTLKTWLSLDNRSTFDKDVIATNNYLNSYVEIYKIPVTKVTMKYRSTQFSVWIVGYGLAVYYDNLPEFSFIDKIRNIFS